MRCVIELFRHQAELHPHSIALEDRTSPGSSRQLTYMQVDNMSDHLSSELSRRGVGPHDIVPILSSRCISSMIAILAVLKRRACYVPMELDTWGKDRIDSILLRTRPKLVITTANHGFVGEWIEHHGFLFLDPDGYQPEPRASPVSLSSSSLDALGDNPDGEIANDWAYLIFTSGTTGRPKGVVVGQASISRLVQEQDSTLPFNLNARSESRVLLIFSFAFDGEFSCNPVITFQVALLQKLIQAFVPACTYVILSTLCNGATLVLSSPSSLGEAAETCSIWIVTPSILAALGPSKRYDSAKCIIMGGEAPTMSLVDAWAAPNRELINVYGPTEATCTVFMAHLHSGRPIVLGSRPVSHLEAIVVDDDGNEADEGELFLSGPGLALGYFEDEELTRRSFVPRADGRIFYRTRDFVKRTAEGYAFCGRKDGVVKNRGFLINLESEVEPAMLRSILTTPNPQLGVDTCAAVQSGGMLIGFISPAKSAGGLRERMCDRNPAFLVPDVIHGLDSLPLTTNGKVDRKTLVELHKRTQLPEFLSVETFQQHARDQGKNIDPLEAVRHAVCVVLRVVQSNVEDETSFRALGGHSLAAVTLVCTLRKLGYSTDVATVISRDTVVGIASKMTKIEIDHGNSTSSQPENDGQIPGWETRPDGAQVAPVTDMQARMLRGTVNCPSLNFIKVGLTFELEGEEDSNFVGRLQAAWNLLAQRHSTLRSTFCLDGTLDPSMVLKDNWHGLVDVKTIDSETTWQAAVATACQFAADDLVSFAMDDSNALHRASILLLPRSKCRLNWIVHHSLIDGWSAGVVMQDLWDMMHEQGPILPSCAQFADAARCLMRLADKDGEACKSFWKAKLQNQTISRLRIAPPSDVSSPLASLAEKHRKLNTSMSRLVDTAKQCGVTTAALVHGAWGILLSRYCDSPDIFIGTVLSGRSMPLQGIDKVVGPLVNSLPLPVRVDPSLPAAEFLRQVFLSLCQLLEFQWTPNSLIQEATGSKGTDYFETLLALQYDFPKPQWPEYTPRICSPPRDISYVETTEMPLTVMLDEADGFLDARFVYLKSHFEGPMIERMMTHFENILSAFLEACPVHIDNATQTVEDVSSNMLDLMELHESLNCTGSELESPYNGPENLANAFQDSLRRHPDQLAVEDLHRSLSYSELDDRTAKVSFILRKHKVIPGHTVCVIADGTIEWLVAIMSVVRTGAAYCPIDHKLPIERQRYMISVCEAPVILFPTIVQRKKAYSLGNASVFLDVESCLSAPGDDVNTDTFDSDGSWEWCTKSSWEDVAVVIFTSGSTGFPKAVQVLNKGILSLLSHPPARLYSEPGQRNAQLLSLGFDCCVMEVFSSLLYGATLVLKDSADPLAHLSRVHATVATPSLIATLEPKNYPDLKIMTLVGEMLPSTLAQKWLPGRRIQNGYAPAECTLIATAHPLKANAPISIGRPVPRVNFYLLDTMGRPVPVGITGEIHISGIQVTPGYLNNPEETKARFLDDPFRQGWKMFRTGDMARWLENREVDYIGRNDNQVKVRGFRIDLGDIEASIARLASNVGSVAVVVSGASLRAFVTPETVDTQKLLKTLRRHLPDYSTPASITAMLKLPMSTNGKVDRTELGKVPLDQSSAHRPPATHTERDIADAWAILLQRDLEQCPISALDAFFEIGGHSLLQIRLAQLLSKQWREQVPLRIVIRHQVLQDLAHALDEHLEKDNRISRTSEACSKVITNSVVPVGVSFQSVERTPRTGRTPASHLEQEMILNHLLCQGSPMWNIVYSCNVYGPVDLHALHEAFKATLAEQEVLRSRFHIEDDGRITRSIEPFHDGQHLATSCTEDRVRTLVRQRVQHPLDPLSEHLLQLHTIRVTPWKTIIVMILSHIIGDGPTLHLLIQEMSVKYKRILGKDTDDTSSEASSPALGYLDWSPWVQDNLLASPQSDETKSFWLTSLADTQFPFNHRAQTYHGHTRTWQVRPHLHKRLVSLSRQHSITMHQMALGAVFLTLQSLQRTPSRGPTTIALGAPMTMRSEVGTEGMLGMFLDRLVVPLTWNFEQATSKAAGDPGQEMKPSFGEFLAMVGERSRAALSHFVPHCKLREILREGNAGDYEPGLERPIFQVMVSFHTSLETAQAALNLGDAVIVEREDARPQCAKFPMMIEFTDQGARGLKVEMECDDGLVDTETWETLESSLSMVLEFLGRGTSVEEVMQALTGLTAAGIWETDSIPTPPAESEMRELGSESEGRGSRHGLMKEAALECLDLHPTEDTLGRSFWEMGAASMDALRLVKSCEKRGLDINIREVFGLNGPLDW